MTCVPPDRAATGRDAPRPDDPGRITLDGQLVAYWTREAARLDALTVRARFGWQRRRLARKAAAARAQADRFRGREAARGRDPAS